MSNVVILNHCKCDVCGHAKRKKELRNWNDRQVCVPCIDELAGFDEEPGFSDTLSHRVSPVEV